jgi:hypothetical protein
LGKILGKFWGKIFGKILGFFFGFPLGNKNSPTENSENLKNFQGPVALH